MKKILTTIFFIGAVKLLLAQTSFMKIYGNKNMFDRCYSGVEASDSGFVMAGVRQDSLSGGWYMSAIKTDKHGNMEWQKQYDQECYNSYITHTIDGGYAILADINNPLYCDTSQINSSSWTSVNAMYLVKIDAQGNKQWGRSYKKKLKRNEFVYARSIQATPDSGYILLGVCGFDNRKVYLVKTNSIGDTLWTKLIDNNSQYDSISKLYGGDDAFDIKNTLDLGFIIMSWSEDSIQKGIFNVIVMRTDSAGNELWRKKFNNSRTKANSIIIVPDSTYLVFVDGWIKMDDQGNILFTTPLDKNKRYINTAGNGYICGTDSYTSNNNYDSIHLIYYNNAFIEQWETTYKYPFKETRINQTFQTKDKGYAIIGYVIDSVNASDFDFLLIKIDSLGNRISGIIDNNSIIATVSVYPNPTKEHLYIDLANWNMSASISLYDIAGRMLVNKQTLSNGINTLQISSFAQGIYFYRIFSDNEVLKSGKIVIQK